MSPASAGSQPVAWAVWVDPLEPVLCVMEGDAEAVAYDSNADMEPLYRKPMLTDAEKIAIKTALVYLKEDEDFPGIAEDKKTLVRLLERLG